MSPNQYILGIEGYKSEGFERKAQIAIKSSYRQKPECCRYCGSNRLRSKGRYQRSVRHQQIDHRPLYWKITTQRWKCVECKRSFVPQLPGIIRYRRSSEPFREKVYEDHHAGISLSGVAQYKKIGTATVERIYQQFTLRKARERLSWQCPKVLGIDEHTLHKGQRFVTTFCDLKNNRIFDVAEGRSVGELEDYLQRLKGRDQVKVVCMDLSSSYRSLVKSFFPNAMIVADRFHVVRLVIYHLLKLMRELIPELAWKRGWLGLLRKHHKNLTPEQQVELERLLEKHPAMAAIYWQKERLCGLLTQKQQSRRSCRHLAKELLKEIAMVSKAGFEASNTLAKTLKSWIDEIARMWRFSKSNSITEGFHRKMKLIQRRAYGIKNFENYRLRVIAQCG